MSTGDLIGIIGGIVGTVAIPINLILARATRRNARRAIAYAEQAEAARKRADAIREQLNRR